MKQRFGLIGASLGHSLSPEIHAKLGGYPYDLIELTEDEVGPFLTSGDFQGLNVTIPYKKTVMKHCTELTPRAAAIGSVNTIVRLDFSATTPTMRALPGWSSALGSRPRAEMPWCSVRAAPPSQAARCCAISARPRSRQSRARGPTTTGILTGTRTHSSSSTRRPWACIRPATPRRSKRWRPSLRSRACSTSSTTPPAPSSCCSPEAAACRLKTGSPCS